MVAETASCCYSGEVVHCEISLDIFGGISSVYFWKLCRANSQKTIVAICSDINFAASFELYKNGCRKTWLGRNVVVPGRPESIGPCRLNLTPASTIVDGINRITNGSEPAATVQMSINSIRLLKNPKAAYIVVRLHYATCTLCLKNFPHLNRL